MYFRRRLLRPEAPSFRGDPKINLEVLCHEATFQECEHHENLRFHNSVRPDLAAPGPRKLRTISPHTSVLSKPLNPYGAYFFSEWPAQGPCSSEHVLLASFLLYSFAVICVSLRVSSSSRIVFGLAVAISMLGGYGEAWLEQLHCRPSKNMPKYSRNRQSV